MLREPSLFKLSVNVPTEASDSLRSTLAQSGAGVLGEYAHCSFSVRGTGRFLPQSDAHPTIGNIGELTCVEEEQIQVVMSKEIVRTVVTEMLNAHPYEEPAYELMPVWQLADIHPSIPEK